MTLDSLISIGAVIAGGVGLGSGAKARLKASRQVATQEVWREEAEAQKARGDRLESTMDDMKEEMSAMAKAMRAMEAEIHRLTGVLRAVAPELLKGGLNDDS